jgi:hypothetical protein
MTLCNILSAASSQLADGERRTLCDILLAASSQLADGEQRFSVELKLHKYHVSWRSIFFKKSPTRSITLSSSAIMSYTTQNYGLAATRTFHQSDPQSLQFSSDVPAFFPYGYHDFAQPDAFLSSADAAAVRSLNSTLP